VKRLLAIIYSSLAYLLFLAAILYTVGFIGGLVVPKSINSGVSGPSGSAVLWDVLLITTFALQHSIMARASFKRYWARLVPAYLERSTYVLAASLVWALVLWQWRPIPRMIWDVRATTLGIVMQAGYWTGWAIILRSTFLISHTELFGLEQVRARFHEKDRHQYKFKIVGLYRWVRHPLYFGFLVVTFSAPVMTIGHLVFAVTTTVYLLIGIYFEERDLLARYGDPYREYRAQVPMLLPFFQWRSEPGHEPTA
jgi:methanethiol S-methyltransferase